MSDNKESIYDGLEYLYAEMLKGKKLPVTIDKVVGGVKFFCPQSKANNTGFDVHLVGTDKKLGVTSATVRRQLFMATGTEVPSEMAGKKIVLYAEKSLKSATGVAIRVAKFTGQ
jgi:hypothetical protein